MGSELLLDTGALISMLDRSQSQHRECVRFFDGWTGPVVTTEAVLTESCHLMSRVSRGRPACLEFVLAGGAVLVPSTLDTLRRCRELMIQVADRPMNLADASLVVLAEELDTDLVFSLDSDFRLYRGPNNAPFRLAPADFH